MNNRRTTRASVKASAGTIAAALGALFAAGITSPAQALIIQPIYTASVTSLPNAITIENAFQAVANVFNAEFSTPITVKIAVSFGNVNGRPLPAGDIGASMIPLLGTFAYSDVTGALKYSSSVSPGDTTLASVVANLPATDPAGMDTYQIPYAEAQALGLLNATIPLNSGFIGFRSGTVFDYNPVGGITAGAYDFQGLAAHEIAEVLGRFSGLPSNGAATYATPYDLLRYTAPGTNSFSIGAHAYFSVDGGVTDLGNFNYSGGGDRGDWLGSTYDSYNAYLKAGVVETLSGNDLTVLDALGYGSWVNTGQGSGYKTTIFAGGAGGAVPEPASWAMLLVGFAAIGAGLRGRARSLVAG